MINRMVWLVGAWDEDGVGYGINGIYTNKSRAEDECEDSSFFIIPVILDRPISDQELLWYQALQRPNFLRPEFEEDNEGE